MKEFRPEQRVKIAKAWDNFGKGVVKRVIGLTGLPEKKALALVRMFHDIHLLGDWNTTLTEHLMPPEEIGKSFVKAAKDFFPPKYAAMVERKLSNIGNYASVSKLAQEYSTCLRECRIGDCMKEAGYKIWKWSIDANIKANEKNELRKNRIRESDFGKEPGGGKDSKLAERKSKRPSVKQAKGIRKSKTAPMHGIKLLGVLRSLPIMQAALTSDAIFNDQYRPVDAAFDAGAIMSSLSRESPLLSRFTARIAPYIRVPIPIPMVGQVGQVVGQVVLVIGAAVDAAGGIYCHYFMPKVMEISAEDITAISEDRSAEDITAISENRSAEDGETKDGELENEINF